MKDPRSRACVPPPLAVARNAAPEGASRRRFLLTAGAALPLAACGGGGTPNSTFVPVTACLLYPSDASGEEGSVDLGGRRSLITQTEENAL
ncbi:hypothetical protein, partial [Pseudacidovorax intermedius]|uniref:hypothetical protein n=1 Tax=Pseudacidovorax intermedius TaxID=433924 RepID=UPI0019D344BA